MMCHPGGFSLMLQDFRILLSLLFLLQVKATNKPYFCISDKLDGNNSSTEISIDDSEDTDRPVWPFIMALIALMFTALGFGSLLGWFYRKEILQFVSDTMSRARLKMGSTDSYGPNGGPPVPPPRHKKFHPINQTNGKGEKRHITPDVISQPMHVTINGLAV